MAGRGGHQPQSPLFEAASLGETFRLEDLIKAGKNDVNQPDAKGFTALHVAITTGNTDCVQILIQKGKANVNVKDRDQTTPLHLAAQKGNYNAVVLLLEAGASVTATDKLLNTPLHLVAAGSGGGGGGYDGVSGGGRDSSAAVTEALLKAGSSLNQSNSAGRTALHLAAKARKVSVVEVLRNHGADTTKKDTMGLTAAQHAEDNQAIQALLRG